MTTSYCTICDNTQQPCRQHPTATRYLDAITYQKTEHGWKVPDSERQRWENPVKGQPPRRIDNGGETRPIQALVAELEGWLFLSNTLETTVRAAYHTNPQRTTRLVDKVVAGARDQALGNPEGYLAKHASEITAGTSMNGNT